MADKSPERSMAPVWLTFATLVIAMLILALFTTHTRKAEVAGFRAKPWTNASQIGAPDDRFELEVLKPSGKDSHLVYPVYYGTDRVARVPFHGVPASDLWFTRLAYAALSGAFVCVLLSRLSGWIIALAGCLVVVSVVLLFRPWGVVPRKYNEMAVEKYGDGRGALAVGVCSVSIPLSHREGELEAASVFKLEFEESPDEHIVLMRADPMELEEFGDNLEKAAQESAWPEALVFVHGYNVSFEDAARRTAQIAHDIKFGGVAAMFSWPSVGKAWAYPWDEQSAEYAIPHFREFMTILAKQGGFKRIHVIAHSMGNRCVFGGLRQPIDLGECKLDQCVFAAPDIDRDIFSRDFPELVKQQMSGKWVGRLTLYASANDKALLASMADHRYSRAGDARAGVLVVKGLESVDATRLETDFLAHSYIGQSPHIIEDLHQMIENRQPAADRKKMYGQKVGSMDYWEFRPDE